MHKHLQGFSTKVLIGILVASFGRTGFQQRMCMKPIIIRRRPSFLEAEAEAEAEAIVEPAFSSRPGSIEDDRRPFIRRTTSTISKAGMSFHYTRIPYTR